MDSISASENRPSWTWADLLSTYRFWGLLLFYLLAGTGTHILLNATAFRLQDSFGIGALHYSRTYIMSLLCIPMGFYLAWIAVRSRTLDTLLFAGCLQALAAGGLVIFLLNPPRGSSAMMPVQMLFFFVYLGSVVVELLIPAVIAGALGSARGFFVAFGALYLSERLVSLLYPIAYSLDDKSFRPVYLLAIVLLLALICLLPVRRALFTEAPPPRGRSLAPSYRGPVAVALLMFVPFYVLYWVYRAHGEAAHLRPSRALLSPRGAVWIWMFPLMGPILLMTLADHLSLRAAEWRLPPGRRAWAIFGWSLFFPPVAFGLVQDEMNRLAAYQRDLPLPVEA